MFGLGIFGMNKVIYKISPTNYAVTLRVTHIKERFPLGYGSIIIEEQNGEKVGKLCGLIRYPEFKGLGICRDLIERRIDMCKTLDCTKVYSSVYYKRKGLIKIYEGLGFDEKEPVSKEYRKYEKILQ